MPKRKELLVKHGGNITFDISVQVQNTGIKKPAIRIVNLRESRKMNLINSQELFPLHNPLCIVYYQYYTDVAPGNVFIRCLLINTIKVI